MFEKISLISFLGAKRYTLTFAVRGRAAVARRAHNPKVGSSILPFATFIPQQKGDFFMFAVYALFSPEHDKIYIGMTSDINERFKSHNELGKKGWTIKFRPWIIIHTELFNNKADALKREKQLKTAAGRKFIRALINHS